VLTVSNSSSVKRSSGNEAENQETVKDGIQETFSPSGKKRLSKSISSYEIYNFDLFLIVNIQFNSLLTPPPL
jgi:hypothetical protein